MKRYKTKSAPLKDIVEKANYPHGVFSRTPVELRELFDELLPVAEYLFESGKLSSDLIYLLEKLVSSRPTSEKRGLAAQYFEKIQKWKRVKINR